MSILSEVYKENPVKHNYIMPLDFSSTKDVPESHAWAQSHDLNINQNNNNNPTELGFFSSVPIIDLDDPNALELIYSASETWGMFQVTNHGISKELLEKVEFQAKKLFDLPFEEKIKVLRSPEEATGYGYPRITPFFSKRMWNEGFTIMGNSFVHHAKKVWPHEFKGFCDVMEEYQTRMKDLGNRLMGLLLKSLNIPEPAIQDELCTALQLNSYPACPDPTHTMGLAQHTDTFLFTILHQSGNLSGLQVYKDGPGWVSVDPVPGALVVNVGDLLHMISNARFPSAVHRAVVNNEKQRLSFAYFYGPPLEFQVSPFVNYSGCKGPVFGSLTVKEYVNIKSKYLDMALTMVRKNS